MNTEATQRARASGMSSFYRCTPRASLVAVVLAALALSPLALSPLAHAQEGEHGQHGGTPDVQVAVQADAISSAEVVKIDKALGKITLRHGPLLNLDMPAMTMAFKVAQPAMLDQVAPGQKVHFVAARVAGALTIMTLQAAAVP